MESRWSLDILWFYSHHVTLGSCSYTKGCLSRKALPAEQFQVPFRKVFSYLLVFIRQFINIFAVIQKTAFKKLLDLQQLSSFQHAKTKGLTRYLCQITQSLRCAREGHSTCTRGKKSSQCVALFLFSAHFILSSLNGSGGFHCFCKPFPVLMESFGWHVLMLLNLGELVHNLSYWLRDALL